jgi:hypothetical protein
MKTGPYEEKHIEDAAGFFQSGFADPKAETHYLPENLQDIDFIATHLKKITGHHPGLAAIQPQHLAGHIVGYSDSKSLKGSYPGAYVPEWGNATTQEGKEVIYEKLYRAISKAWVDRKRNRI